MNGRVVRIGGGSGMWGDDLDAPRRLVDGGPVDYVMLDFLAEVTMSVLQRQRTRDPSRGYATDVVGMIESVLPALSWGTVKVLTNAGGVNPAACAAAIAEMAARAGKRQELRIGLVTGDDLLPGLDALLAAGHEFRHMESGEPLAMVRDRVVAANAYLGSAPLADALALGANVVVSGRCHDAALAVAPLRHEFGWAPTDYDLLAAGTVAGHVIECGAQSSGGNCLADWRTMPDLADVGYPIVEVSADGRFVVTKHPGTGGRVSAATVTEQLVYEIGDPRAYVTADCVTDFTSIKLIDERDDRVYISGVRGGAPTGKLKVSIAYHDGYKAVGTLVYGWPDAVEKARAAERIVRARLDRLGLAFERVHVELVGAGATHGPLAGPDAGRDAPEVQFRFGVRDRDRANVERFTREIAPLVLNGPPTVTGYFGARAKVEEILGYWPALVDAAAVTPRVELAP
ncbi:MAG TPA: acyclic terpene utilization AtuA family protein [Gemmatimonadaceae bacterium]|nr:acyclic terpene utilization AtuA family protein [Gemmatimonadaceae bacterium]